MDDKRSWWDETPFDHLERLRCGGCGEVEKPDVPHRRGRCRRCYDGWVRERPVGLGAYCGACGERRTASLRHFELRKTWVVLCHNCSARAETMDPMPFTVSGLRLKLHRERRHGDRRAEAVGRDPMKLLAGERRDGDRRDSERSLFDATEFAELVLELEAEFADEQAQPANPEDGDITGVHALVDVVEAGGGTK